MPDIDFTLSVELPDSYRANRVRSLFNATREQAFTHRVQASMPIEAGDIDFQPWSLGLVVGPSGSGKTSIAREALGGRFVSYDWPPDGAVVDAIGSELPLDQITTALASVGLGTVPSWLRPYRVLSGGEQFRALLARLLLEPPEGLAIVDEFTSVVDRQVAKIGAGAFAKAWRRGPANEGHQFVALACHRDIVDWLQPDWVLDTEDWTFRWRSLQPAPGIKVDISRTSWRAWPFFEKHHYLKLNRIPASYCYVGQVDGEPVAHLAVSTMSSGAARFARLVVMPEWQGAGVGLRFLDCIAEEWYRGRNPYNRRMTGIIHTSHPGLVAALQRRAGWVQTKQALGGVPSTAIVNKKPTTPIGGFNGHFRAQAGFRYVGDRT